MSDTYESSGAAQDVRDARERVTITKLERNEHGWTANVNGQPFHTTGPSGTMSAWVSRDDREALPVVRARLVDKVRKVEAREAAEAEVTA